jgi:hypothetical protein
MSSSSLAIYRPGNGSVSHIAPCFTGIEKVDLTYFAYIKSRADALINLPAWHGGARKADVAGDGN